MFPSTDTPKYFCIEYLYPKSYLFHGVTIAQSYRSGLVIYSVEVDSDTERHSYFIRTHITASDRSCRVVDLVRNVILGQGFGYKDRIRYYKALKYSESVSSSINSPYTAVSQMAGIRGWNSEAKRNI